MDANEEGKLVDADTKAIRSYTHLYLQNKSLKEIPKIVSYTKLSVLCLFENKIAKIEHLEPLINLRSLYLQKNEIRVLENLEALTKLEKLHLGHNAISVVENLERLTRLQELHIEKQRLKKCDALCFDPRTINTLLTLQVLNISCNNISSLQPLIPLRKLRILIAANNRLTNLDDILNTIRDWYYLFEASFEGNPVTKQHRYKETIIAQTMRLEMLDNKEVNSITRNFMQRFQAQTRTKNVNLADLHTDLPKSYPTALQKAVSSSIIKTGLSAMNICATNNQNHSHINWNALPKTTLKTKQMKRK